MRGHKNLKILQDDGDFSEGEYGLIEDDACPE
jgi:hypothetical protein